MTKLNPFKIMFAIVAMFAAVACDKSNPAPEKPAPDPVASFVGECETTQTSIKFTAKTENAVLAKYIYAACSEVEFVEELARLVDEEGVEIEANKSVEVEILDLMPDTDYFIGLLADGEEFSIFETMIVKTDAPEILPEVSAEIGEDIGYDYLTFTYSAQNAEVVKYVCIKAGSRDVAPEQVIANGVTLEADAEGVEVKVDGLDSSTAYEVYVAAQRGAHVVMSDKLEAETQMEVIYYNIALQSAVSQPGSSQNNFFVVLTDVDNNQLKLDLYSEEVATYLPTARYFQQGESDNYFNTTYTMFYKDGSEGMRFATGSIEVTAEPNEETREIFYTIEGELITAEGDFVLRFSYNGLIEGYQLPPAGIEIPEGAIYFEPDANINQPVRLKANGEQMGEYYIKFYDKNWSELTIDILADPALCNNGNAQLPAGTYSLADGTLDPYTGISLYAPPYTNEYFAEATVEVAYEGLEYTFEFLGTTKTSGTVFYMKWSGEIKDMVRE